MIRINLRDYYPFYSRDSFIDVEDIIATTLNAFDLNENAYKKRMYRYKAYFSLDRNDGIERDAIFIISTPPEIYEKKVTSLELYDAFNRLSEKQAKRIYAHFFLGISKYAISRVEGVDESAVRKSIKTGLKQLKKYLKEL